ncbi:hypothetical protein FRB96_000615 [Tulasnella sp. 330]|nr:hypothetical protein FRB96_000615 [Tulasnella sp. 330]
MTGTVYVALLPFQLWVTLKYLTGPATAIALATLLHAFTFYGIIAAGEEIENPFGYEKNDMNFDHFIDKIIQPELDALTSRPIPDVAVWAFSSENTHVFFWHGQGEMGVGPEAWMGRGHSAMRAVLAKADPV